MRFTQEPSQFTNQLQSAVRAAASPIGSIEETSSVSAATVTTATPAVIRGGHNQSQSQSQGHRQLLVCLLIAVPALILWVPAQATEGCAHLASSLNGLRAAAGSDGDMQTRVSDLESYLDRLNGGQGPGFTVFGWLVTHRLVYSCLIASLPIVNLLSLASLQTQRRCAAQV